MSQTISSCLIVKNEINNLPGLIEELKSFSDEIIIVDTGSSDGTYEWLIDNQDSKILKVYTFEWINDFSAARNYSFSKASCDWIFWCDADDRLSGKLIYNIIKTKQSLEQYDCNGFIIKYLFSQTCIVPNIRLIRRSCGPVWEGACHETLVFDGDDNVISFDDESLIVHQREHTHSDRNLYIFINQILKGEPLSYRDYYYYSCELRDNGYIDKACDVIENKLYDLWYVDAWNAIVYTLNDKYISNPEYGISIINKFEESNYLRGDVLFLRGWLKYLMQDTIGFIEDCKKAINMNPEGLDGYLENTLYSKVWPAINLYNLCNDVDKQYLINIISIYREVYDEANKFLINIGI